MECPAKPILLSGVAQGGMVGSIRRRRSPSHFWLAAPRAYRSDTFSILSNQKTI
ncbi:hypothetical protein [Brasilonema bromeliae]|uniref:hypothetical protein n=1 Tax=Brasilonema bromeliae TaxID=383615 RepID=UPI00145E1563|nr:hypothetical protein [Brasilonema bromeliae]